MKKNENKMELIAENDKSYNSNEGNSLNSLQENQKTI